MKYFHILNEGDTLAPGVNFYSWQERDRHLGFVLDLGPLVVTVRWDREELSPRLLIRSVRRSPEQRCRACNWALNNDFVLVPRTVALDFDIPITQSLRASCE